MVLVVNFFLYVNMNALQKTYQLSSLQKVCCCKINSTKILAIYKKSLKDEKLSRQYILIPDAINYEKKGNFLIFSCPPLYSNQFITFNNSFSFYLKSFEKKIRKKILLTGLGFKVNFSKDLKGLEFKIGLSHLVYLEIPINELTVFLLKNTIIVEGVNQVCLGNFLKKIKNLKIPGAYTGKGFWYKNEIKVLNPVKKT
jgi:hypothetical protein